MKKPYSITALDFRKKIWEEIKDLPDDAEITFGGGDLMFFRMKPRGDFLCMEFNQVYTVTVDPDAE